MFRLFCFLIFKATGWKFVSNVPDDLRSFIFIGAPHTANYDFIMAMAVSYQMKRNARFVIKKEWLKFPLNLFFGPIGGIGIDRNVLKEDKTISNTDLMADLFKQNSELVIMIAPEGTRSANKTWKTGFYYIAQKANVPLVLGFADYKTKTAGMGMVLYPEDFDKDMMKIMQFYKNMEGKVPENFQLDQRYLPES
ncbi:MAG: 1-acyl-sn-glycerol-3-phosphate acyltransferase [Bdellovibrionales bacterium]|nr:1-acyl-sn-glycerol-3-phosphate acyltransferase [Bdellovibrionales bacterium]